MVTQTRLVAQQVRIRQWAAQIRDCQNRPKGMDVETWCAQNNLTKANYYYRLWRVRKVCLDQSQDTTAPAFVELPAPDDKTAALVHGPAPDVPVDTTPVIRIKNISGLSAEVFSTASPEMFHHLIEAFSHVE